MNNKQEEMEETNMKMIKAIVRPEKSEDVLDALLAGGFAAATKMSVLGRGKQKGLKVGDTYYDEIPKELIMLVVEDGDVDKVLKVIVENARVDKNGTYGDGKIFVSDVERAITIRYSCNWCIASNTFLAVCSGLSPDLKIVSVTGNTFPGWLSTKSPRSFQRSATQGPS